MNGGTAVDAGGAVAGGRPFGRLAIVNRGEPAMRLINAVREWNAEGRPPLRTIALHTAADRRAMFVREADEALLIGPDPDAASADGRVDLAGPNPYLDLPGLARALRACRAEAVWPGWGFVSENPEFARLCGELGIVFVGPHARRHARPRRQDRLEAARRRRSASRWRRGAAARSPTSPRPRAHAEEIGYPLMVKATAGGGGRGIRLVDRPERAGRGVRPAPRPRAPRTFGRRAPSSSSALRARRGRHVEVQVVADATGDVWTLGVRDCSVQRRNQKVIEESASTALDAEQERAAARRPRPAGAARRATSTPAPSSSSTSRASGCCRSWRSTRGCRSSTRSPRRPPASTSSSCSCTWRRAAGWPSRRGAARAVRPRHRGPADRRGPRAATSPPPPA